MFEYTETFVETGPTLESYFEQEYLSAVRHEFIHGRIIPTAYTSPEHGTIVQNLSRLVGNCLHRKKAQIWVNDRMLYIPDPGCDQVFYPDALIVDGEPIHHQYKGKMKATMNPAVLVEVMSDTTEALDRTDKWACYQNLPSLKKYVLISQKFAFVECFDRNDPSSKWSYASYRSASDAFKILSCKITLNDLYEKVVFPLRTTGSTEK